MRRPSPFLWLVLGILGLALVLLLLRRDAETVAGLPADRFAQLAFLVAILVFLISGLYGRGDFARMARYALVWALIGVFVVVGYTYRDEIGAAAEGLLAQIFPPQQTVVAVDDDGDANVVVNRPARSAHFVVVAELNNGAQVEMVIDTGATIITLTAEDARLAGISTRRLVYSVTVATANGMARAAPVTLDRLTIGPIEQTRVVALVAEEGVLETSLLGLNFLNALSSYTVSGNQMVLVP